MRADIIGELDELTALVADVVELARGTKPDQGEDDVRLDTLVEDLVERARRRAGSAVHFKVELEPTLVRGDPERLARAVSNLLGNAAKWSPPGGTVEVGLAAAVLTVRDHGPGFEEQDMPARIRALLPRGGGARDVGLGAGPGDRAAGRRGPRWIRRGRQRGGRGRPAAGELRAPGRWCG